MTELLNREDAGALAPRLRAAEARDKEGRVAESAKPRAAEAPALSEGRICGERELASAGGRFIRDEWFFEKGNQQTAPRAEALVVMTILEERNTSDALHRRW
jgi:hypothetical protein